MSSLEKSELVKHISKAIKSPAAILFGLVRGMHRSFTQIN
jgi:hypothetical protein